MDDFGELIMARQFPMVSCRYGAPMGRDSFGILENVEPRTLRLYRVRLDISGYDDGGAYWGRGGALWCATDGADYRQFTRAGTRERAAINLQIAPGYLDRLARPIDRGKLGAYALATLENRAPKWNGWTEQSAHDVLQSAGNLVAMRGEQ
jgi:hypothetical protein